MIKATRIISVIAMAAVSIGMLSACGENAPPPQPQMSVEDKQKFFNTLEDNRQQGRDNAAFVASIYRSENPRLEGTKIVTHGDSTQSADCPQGDGWATVSFMNIQGTGPNKEVEKYVAKCSTVSTALGCYLDKDFEKKPFAREENHCNPTLPFPLPKLAK